MWPEILFIGNSCHFNVTRGIKCVYVYFNIKSEDLSNANNVLMFCFGHERCCLLTQFYLSTKRETVTFKTAGENTTIFGGKTILSDFISFLPGRPPCGTDIECYGHRMPQPVGHWLLWQLPVLLLFQHGGEKSRKRMERYSKNKTNPKFAAKKCINDALEPEFAINQIKKNYTLIKYIYIYHH